jgi:hypothetical protein
VSGENSNLLANDLEATGAKASKRIEPFSGVPPASPTGNLIEQVKYDSD